MHRPLATLSLILLVIAFTQFAQGQEPLEHKKTSWTAPDGKLYWNRLLPIYLRIASNRDGSKNNHLLESTETPAYANPMYLDMDGYNSIRSPWEVDTVTKKPVYPKRDIIFEVYADGTAPVSSTKFQNSTYYRSGATRYYAPSLQVNLDAMDETAGVKQIYYSLNGAPFGEYKKALHFDEGDENNFTLKYYAVDHVGNAEEVKTETFVIDREPPEAVTKVIDKDGNETGFRVNQYAALQITTTDALSGVKSVKYSLDGAPAKTYTRPIPVAGLSSGLHTLSVYTVDNVDNSRNKQALTGKGEDERFELDKEPPKAEIAIMGDQHEGKYLYVSPRTKFKISASDEQSVVEDIQYGVNEASAPEQYSQAFELQTPKGVQTIYYTAIDSLQNKAKTGRKVVYLDDATPVTAIDIKRPQFFNRDTLFISKSTPIELFAKDYESGLDYIEYSVDGGDFRKFEGNFNIEEEGFHSIKFRSYDKVQNLEPTKESEVFVDNNAPAIYANFSIRPTGSEQQDGETLKVYPTYTKLYLGATDKNSGAESIHYRVNDGELTEYASSGNLDVSEARMLKEEGHYTITIYAKDKLGNESENIIEFFIRKN